MKKKNLINILSLFLVQGSNAVLPILVFPFVLSTLGAAMYSKIVVTESIIFIPYAFTLYSFEVDGVSGIIKHRTNKKNELISEMFNEILNIRILIFIISLILILFSSFFVDVVTVKLLLLWMLFPLSYILQNSYFYLAQENNLPLAISIVLSRILCLLSIYYLVNKDSSIYIVPLIIGACYMCSGLFSLIFIIVKFKIRLQLSTWKKLKARLINGKEIFFGNISVLLFKDLNVIILSVFVKDANVIAGYSISEKIVKSMQASLRPINQYFYPKGLLLLEKFSTANALAFKAIYKITKIQLLIILAFTTLFYLVFFIISNYNLVDLNSSIKDSKLLIGIMIISIFFGVLNFMYGTLGLNHLMFKKYFAKAIFYTGITSLLCSILLTHFLGVYGTAINFVLAEIILFCLILLKYRLF